MNFDPHEIRKSFPMYSRHCEKFNGLPLVYLDNSATTFKPQCVIDSINHYYCDITANTRRGDYSLANAADKAFDDARKTIASFLNADEPEEVIFTSGDTQGLNELAYGLIPLLKEGDEIILSPSEHASNVLPWFQVCKITKATIRYVPLDEKGMVTKEGLLKVINDKTKVVSLASVSNVMGYQVNVKELVQIAHSYHAIYIDDAAQSVAHQKTDVKDTDVDFLVFSGHKMCGPTGIGVLYGKRQMLERLSPLLYGGEMNARFHSDGYLSLDDVPYRFEAGTQNVAGVLGLARACQFLEEVGFDKIQKHEMELRKLAIEGLKKNGNAVLYNPDADTGIITFNIKNVFPQDVATYLSHKGVFVRSGTHCAKILPEFLHVEGTVRASLYLYNTKEDVLAFVDACAHAEDFLDAFFD